MNYAKQTQFPKSQMNVKLYNTKDYENKSNWTLGENKPNSKPIKPNSKPIKPNSKPIKPNSPNAQNQRNIIYNKGLRKYKAFQTPKNKPNTNPIQTQLVAA
jgi:hypothetical protein